MLVVTNTDEAWLVPIISLAMLMEPTVKFQVIQANGGSESHFSKVVMDNYLGGQ